MAKATFDIKTEAQRGLHAGVGAADLAIETIKKSVADAQKRLETYQKDAQKRLTETQKNLTKSVRGIDLQPQALRSQATTVFNARVEELSKDAKARRSAVEKRVAELQAEAQKFVTGNVETATGTYESLAKRGETVVNRLRKETAAVADPGPVKKSTGATVTAPAKKAAPRKTTAKKTTAKKAPAKKAPAKKTAGSAS